MARNKMTRARYWFKILFPCVSFLVFAYPINRLSHWYGPEATIGTGLTVLIWLFATAALWYSFRSPKMFIRYIMVHWMGGGFILFVLTLLYEVARLFLPVQDHTSVIWILGAAFALVVVAVIASHFLSVKRLEFATEKITAPHRIVQISDVHIGSRRGGYLQRIVKRINQLEPDVVVITGDLVDSSSVGHTELKCLRRLHARTLFTIGNHERYVDLDKVLSLLTNLGVESLRQQQVMAGEIRIIGIDDADAPTQVADKLPSIECPGEPDSEQYTVLLYHRPMGWDAAVEHGIDLMLSGHTHNGQIFPFNLLVKRQYNRIRGLYSDGDRHLYVSPGTGTWGPLMRLGSLNEITCIDLKPAGRPPPL